MFVLGLWYVVRIVYHVSTRQMMVETRLSLRRAVQGPSLTRVHEMSPESRHWDQAGSRTTTAADVNSRDSGLVENGMASRTVAVAAESDETSLKLFGEMMVAK